MSPEMVAENWRSPEANSLDLNNLPPQDYYTRDVPQAASASSPGGRKKKSGGGRAEKEEAGKVYECRFCSLKFCKSQALGGHMNRHRQERETETLNKARQLVFSNDLAPPPPPPPHIGYVPSGQGYHQPADDSSLAFRSLYPTTSRMFSTAPPPQAPQVISYPSAANNYYVGNVSCYGGGGANYYTCIGAPVSTADHDPDQVVEGRNWGRR